MADRKKAAVKPDFATIGGLILAFGGILGGLVLEGGKIRDVTQFTAAVIVLGGTLGAVMVTTPLDVLIRAAKKFLLVFMDTVSAPEAVIEDLIAFATKARKSGIAALEHDAEEIDDHFLKKAISLAVDGTDVQEIRKMMEIEITVEECRWEAEAKVYEAAGGYSPTVGIIGAVLGLIQVMKHLENIDEVGHGIAVAFVATVYGVAAANLLFLPAAHKIKARAANAIQMRELMLEGVIGIAEGLNPKLIKIKLDAYIQGYPAKGNKGGVRNPAPQTAAAEA
ncbi:MAG: flagellar motor protein [Acidobacteriota bacterium]|nr:flagellar motor protein [Acidobacteriota bacterium]